MSRRLALLAATSAAAVMAGAPVAMAQADSITATGIGQARVHPKNRHNNASIAAAVAAAQQAAVVPALAMAHQDATGYATAAGLTLGSLESISDASSNNGPYGYQYFGPFGPNRYCGTLRQPVIKRVGNRIKVLRVRKVHRCFVPRFANITLTVTYAASPASSPAPGSTGAGA